MTPDQALGIAFSFFNEVGIVNQLSSALLQKRLGNGFTVAQFSVLNHLIRVKDGQTPMALASAFQVPKTSMTHSLTKLEQNKLIELRSNPKDGRSKCVWITEAGKNYRETTIASLSGDIARLSDKLDFDAIQQALPVLQQVRQILDEDRNED